MTKRRIRLTSAQIIPASFLITILIGTLLLLLPPATVRGEHTGIMTALFTATTSVCVTGLVVVDTYAHWTLFGKIVILILIQLGGLGIVTSVGALIVFVQKRLSLRNQMLIYDAFNLDSLSGLFVFLKKVLAGTFIVEGAGALAYLPSFLPRYGAKGIWYAAFTSVSAFCNAGIDILGPDSLISFQKDPLVLTVTMLLIVLGGLGFLVWFDIIRVIKKAKKKKYGIRGILSHMSVHSKLVLSFTLFLILSGAAAVMAMEWTNAQTIGNMGFGSKVLNSIFQSVTFRTAGFATIPQEMMRTETSLLGCVYMLIGGSPVGTAGGLKTVVIAIVLFNALSFVRGKDQTTIFRHGVAEKTIRKANAIVTVSVLLVLVMTIALLISCRVPLIDGLYETVSAICTVGLSRHLTASLNLWGRLIIVICMYLGRIGPISMALFFSTGKNERNIRYAEGNFTLG